MVRRSTFGGPGQVLPVAAIILGFLGAAVGADDPAKDAAAGANDQGAVRAYRHAVHIVVEGMIGPFMKEYLFRKLAQAESMGADLVILEIDSPGGEVEASLDVAARVRDVKWARTVAYIPRQALSGAAFLALGCDEIVMHPAANLGDAGPVVLGPDAIFREASEKIVSHLARQLRDLAQAKGRPPALAEAMVDHQLEVFRYQHRHADRAGYFSKEEIESADDREDWDLASAKLVLESRAGRFLEVNGLRAKELGLAQATAQSSADVQRRYGLAEPPQVLKANWVDNLVYVLNRPVIAILLLVVGIVCLYVELHTPGIGIAGMASGLSFLLFFWSKFLGGTAGWLEVVLFLAGIACLAIEILLLPGTGIPGVTGALLIFASIVLASQTFILPRSSQDLAVLARSFGILGVAAGTAVAAAAAIARYLPSIPILNAMMLAPPGSDLEQADGARAAGDLAGAAGDPAGAASDPAQRGPGAAADLRCLVGQEGVARTLLRPAGKAAIGEQYLDVVAEGSFIPDGCRLRVVQVSGNRIVVRQIPDGPGQHSRTGAAVRDGDEGSVR